MSDILKQIQALQEQFNNLFEVDGDGLGQPAVDVPPSQNKIKKDVKTKNGKAELVSVEDELFPYDGNKREQYRQKILDTINGMIQGTSTLEDLLQIVRQKKAPLKEAMELMEAVINELYPDTVKSALHAHNKKTVELEDKVNKRIGEIFKKHGIKGNTYSAATAEDRQKAAETEKEIKEDPEIKDLHNQQERRAKKNELYRNAIRKARKSSVEEALEIMEAIINEVSDKTAQGALDAAQQRYNRKGYEASMKLFRGDSKGAIEDGNKAQDEYNKHLNLQLKRAKRLGKKLVQDKNDHDSFKIKEALSLMEAIINEVSMDKWKEAAASSLPKRQEKALKSEEDGKQIWKDYEEASKKSPEDEPSLYRKAEKDAEAHAEEHKKNVDRASQAELVSLLKTKGKSANKTIKAAKKVQDERAEDFYENPNAKTISRKVKASSVATADPVKSRNEAN